jgi:hypothetical protein
MGCAEKNQTGWGLFLFSNNLLGFLGENKSFWRKFYLLIKLFLIIKFGMLHVR